MTHKLKGVPDKTYQRIAVLKYEFEMVNQCQRERRESLFVVGSDPEIVDIRAQLKPWELAALYAPRGRGRAMDIAALDQAAAVLDAKGVKVKVGYTSRATILLMTEPKFLSSDGARDRVRRLAEISRRTGARRL